MCWFALSSNNTNTKTSAICLACRIEVHLDDSAVENNALPRDVMLLSILNLASFLVRLLVLMGMIFLKKNQGGVCLETLFQAS